MLNSGAIWIVIISLGIGTYLIRFSFLGLIGSREMPEWFLRHLRYVAVAVMPALITPLILWPKATQGEPDPARLIAALMAFFIGIKFKSVFGAILAGLISLYGVQYLLA